MSEEIHVDDIGTVFRATVTDEDGNIVDLSSATTKTFLFGKPSGSVLTKSASFTTDGTDGKLYYTSIEGDIDSHGTWTFQVFVDFGSTQWYTNITKFKVYKNIGCS
jgi:hypothetical protein